MNDLPALISVNYRHRSAIVCAWCDQTAKRRADNWAHANGFSVSHGMCPACFQREMGVLGDAGHIHARFAVRSEP